MAFSNGIKIYTTSLSPQMNAQVDNIEYYLTNKCTLNYDLTELAYVKFDLDMDLKLNIPDGLEIQYNKSLGNYVAITQENKTWFYFIIGSEWTAKRTVKLNLSIDSINTFKDNLIWKSKTHILRQHKDRLLPRVAYSTSGDNNTYVVEYNRKIDRRSENTEVPKLKFSDITLEEDDSNWYLMYRSVNNPDPEKATQISALNCYLFADKELTISQTGGGSARIVTAADFPVDEYNYILDSDNPDLELSIECKLMGTNSFVSRTVKIGSTITYGILVGGGTSQYRKERVKNLKLMSNGTNILVLFETSVISTVNNKPSDFDNYFCYFWHQNGTGWSASSDGCPSINIKQLNFTRNTYDGNVPYAYAQTLITTTREFNIGPVIKRRTITLDNVDKTDTRILKIIKLPYCPVNYTVSGGVYSFGDQWSYESGFLKLNSARLSLEFLHNIVPKYDNCRISEIKDFGYTNVSASSGDWLDVYQNAPKDTILDSKIYHSDFYTFKFLYDSFSKDIKLEDLKLQGDAIIPYITVDLKFKPTNTINSKFAFHINPQCAMDIDNDYPNYLLIDRNNEETIFTNDYLNYIRNGYNYDKKAIEDNIAKGNLAAGLQLGGGILSLLSSTATGGFSAAAGISLTTSAINTLVNTKLNEQQQRANLERKLNDLAMQSATVKGSNDIDLLTFYNQNRLHLVKYSPSVEDTKLLSDMFYYSGYSTDEYSIPNLNSRLWFNYIQCEPEFDEMAIAPYSKYLDDIKERYRKGVTVYHKVADNYDLNQTKENWEKSIYFVRS